MSSLRQSARPAQVTNQDWAYATPSIRSKPDNVKACVLIAIKRTS